MDYGPRFVSRQTWTPLNSTKYHSRKDCSRIYASQGTLRTSVLRGDSLPTVPLGRDSRSPRRRQLTARFAGK
jgi:hypothetical protein